MTTMEASLECLSDNIWGYVSKLVRLRWALLVSGIKRAKPVYKALSILLGLLALGIFVGCFLLTTSFLRFLDSPTILESGINLDTFMDAIPTLIVSGAFLAILMTSFGVLLQALYLANDMDFLLATPIPIRAIFLTKLLQAVLPNFILVMLIGLPVLFGLGVEGGYQALYYPLVVIVLGFLSLAAAGISSLLVMTVVRIIPAKRVAEVLAFLGIIFFMLLSQWSNLTGVKHGSVSPEQISKGSQVLSTLNNAGSPLAWGGRGLVDMGEGRFLSGTIFLALTLGLSGGVFWLALGTAERLYYSGWASLQVGTQRKKALRAGNRRSMDSTRASVFQRVIASDIRAFMLKDFKLVRRDLRIMSQQISAVIMGIVFAAMLFRSMGGPAGNGESLILAYGNIGISLFVGYAVLYRLALISFSVEGKSFWIIKTAPISAGRQLAAKFLIAYLPGLIVTWLFLLGIAFIQRVPAANILYSLTAEALILAGLDGISLTIGVRGANINWTDPRRMLSATSDYLAALAGLVYMLASLLLFFGPLIGLPLLNISEKTGMLIGLVAGGTVALLCMILPLALVKKRVYRIGEE
jgi:ABC-2 type transport system permease protein